MRASAGRKISQRGRHGRYWRHRCIGGADDISAIDSIGAMGQKKRPHRNGAEVNALCGLAEVV